MQSTLLRSATRLNSNVRCSVRKRLRKKNRLGEFREYGFEIAFEISSQTDWNGVFTAFIEEAIERHGLQFGGSPHGGFATVNKPRASATQRHREMVRSWLETRSDVSNVRIGELRDACHGWRESGVNRNRA